MNKKRKLIDRTQNENKFYKNQITKISKDQIKNTIQTKPSLLSQSENNQNKDEKKNQVLSFEDLIQLTSKKKEIQEKFEKREINRLYLAVVWGLLKKNSGSFTMNIGRNPKNRKKFSTFKDGGRNAITKYKVKKNFSNVASLIECKLLTGRTHQIRVHLSSSGNSIIGDKKYGRNKSKLLKNVDKSLINYIITFKRQALHAYFLSFIHPIKKNKIELNSKLPNDINALIEQLKLI